MLNEILIASGNRSNEDLENTVIETELMSPSKEIIYPMLKVREEILTALRRANVDEEIISKLTIGEAPEGIEGDFGFHCATLARILRKSPLLIAKELVESLSVEDGGFITKYSAEGPYVNASLDYERFATEVCMQVIELGADYGKEKIGMGQRVVVDMSSPNIAKRMSIGHLRSTIIGDSLAKIFHHLDYEVIKDNHIGDWGTQFGHLLRAIELWGDPEVITKNPIEELQKLYVRISDA